MPGFKGSVKVKWGKEVHNVDVDTSEDPEVFKASIFSVTGVQPNRQKVMLKGGALKEGQPWPAPMLKAMKPGVTILMMGSKEEDIPTKPVEETKFVEDMDESELQSALEMPAGLQNLGNTCYLNATVQCLKTVPEFRDSLKRFEGSVNLTGVPGTEAQSMTAAVRDLYKTMDAGRNFPPIVLVQVLHMIFPRFAEKSDHGGFQQQDANECWVELMNLFKQKLPSIENSSAESAIDQYFGLTFDTETKCAETEDEPATKRKEHFYQYNCYIDKDVKFLHTGLKNRLTETMEKNSETLGREAQYVKKLAVSRLPGYLTIQMVRFQFKQKDAVNAKILKDIKFPMQLDTFDLCSPELQQKLVPMRKKFKAYEDKVVHDLDKQKGLGKDEALRKTKGDDEGKESLPWCFEDDLGSNNSGYYELQAVLTHKGRSSNSGHYVAWVKHKGDTWIECNDDDVRPIHVEEVMKLSGGGDWHTAYLLLYGPRKLPKDALIDDEEKKEEPKTKADDTPMETN